MTTILTKLLRLVSYGGLLLSLVSAFLVFHETLTKETYFKLMVVGMLMWFGTAIFWIKPEQLGE